LTLVLLVALCAAGSFLLWHANACQRLLEFDVDSFIRIRLYSRNDDRFLPLADPSGDLCAELADPRASQGLRRALGLHYKPAGFLYEAFLIARELLPSTLRRR
jgi:hypothetical protein